MQRTDPSVARGELLAQQNEVHLAAVLRSFVEGGEARSRLDEKPARQGIISDLTCDSDGKIDKFIDRRDVRKTLDLHERNNFV